MRFGFGKPQIALCVAIAIIPAKAIPIESEKLVQANENCFSSSGTFETDINENIKYYKTFFYNEFVTHDPECHKHNFGSILRRVDYY